MRILVINLARSADRLAHIGGQLAAMSLAFERIEACDGRLLSEAERAAFAAARPRDGKKGWGAGQIGCFTSHMNCWRSIAAGTDAHVLILEDDVHLSTDLPRFVTDPSWIPASADIVRIETTGQWLRLGSAAPARDRTIMRLRSTSWGAGGYILSHSAAQRLIATSPALHEPADFFLFDASAGGIARELVTFQLVPALCAQDKFDDRPSRAKGFGSEIETVVNQRLGFAARVRRSLTSTLGGKTRVDFR